MVQLVPMAHSKFEAYLESDIQRYAEAQVQAGSWHPTEALDKSRKQHEQLLPEGLATKNNYFYSIVDAGTGSEVGVIWFAVDHTRVEPLAFVFDFLIHAEFRRKGYGTQALRALEDRVRELGANRIGLHVFGYNHAAYDLYRKVGYEVSGINMIKSIE